VGGEYEAILHQFLDDGIKIKYMRKREEMNKINPEPLSIGVPELMVELEGVEPSSRQSTLALSTCLASD
jgi:hypothetical protein